MKVFEYWSLRHLQSPHLVQGYPALMGGGVHHLPVKRLLLLAPGVLFRNTGNQYPPQIGAVCLVDAETSLKGAHLLADLGCNDSP
jgi:hypothetical protein